MGIGEKMCLAIPTLITKIEGTGATVEIGSITRCISLILTPNAKTGDYVLVHAGYSISVISPEEAEETLNFLHEMGETEHCSQPGSKA